MRLLAIVGSLGARSSNRLLLERAAAIAPAGIEVTVFADLGSLPHFDPDLPDDAAPAPVRAFRAAIAAHDAVLVASPEYGHSLPGVLKNAIDWCIGSGELEGKIVGVTAAVAHVGRGQAGLDAVAKPLGAVSAKLVFCEPTLRGDDEALAARLRAIAEVVAAR